MFGSAALHRPRPSQRRSARDRAARDGHEYWGGGYQPLRSKPETLRKINPSGASDQTAKLLEVQQRETRGGLGARHFRPEPPSRGVIDHWECNAIRGRGDRTSVSSMSPSVRRTVAARARALMRTSNGDISSTRFHGSRGLVSYGTNSADLIWYSFALAVEAVRRAKLPRQSKVRIDE